MVAPLILSGILSTVGQIADDLLTSDEEKGKLALEQRKLDLAEKELDQRTESQQISVNVEEGKSSSIFVAGWRPAVGWVCVSACAWNWIGLPMAKFGAAYAGVEIDLAPADTGEMLPVLLGMLGLGSLRTFEKIKKVAR